MSLRPPSTYWIRVTGTGGGGSSDSASFTLAASGDTAVPTSLTSAGGQLFLQGLEFEAAANTLTFSSTPSVVPTGITPSTIAETVAAPCFKGKVPGKINAATTAFPFILHYGPLGPGAR